MEDVMILMHQSILDIVTGFDETDFGVFIDEDQQIINELWAKSKGNVLLFMRYLSPDQKICITHWMVDRITYPKQNLIIALESFLKFLKSPSYNKYSTYPKYKDASRKKGKESSHTKKKRFFLP